MAGKRNIKETRLVSALFQWSHSGYDPMQPCNDVPFVNNFQFKGLRSEISEV